MSLNKSDIEAVFQKRLQAAEKKFGKDFKLELIELIGLDRMLQPVPEPEKKDRLIPLVDWNKYHPDPSVPALRMLVFRKDENGFDKVVDRRGKRVLINERLYFEWAEENSKHRV